MKKEVLALMIGFLLIGANAFAADGDLIVNGNVGIGTTGPDTKLRVSGGVVAVDNGQAFWIRNAANSSFVNMVTLDSNNQMLLGSAGVTGDLVFSAGGERMRINSTSGNVGIGTTSPGSYKLYVNGSAYSTGGWAGSDVRWKKNITPLQNSLERILKLQGVSFDWKVDEYKDKNFDKGKQIGIIAQEVEKVLPDLVKTDNEGYKAVSYEKLTAVLVEAIKEQQKGIEELKAEIRKIKGERQGGSYEKEK